jgi:hypothetical protein
MNWDAYPEPRETNDEAPASACTDAQNSKRGTRMSKIFVDIQAVIVVALLSAVTAVAQNPVPPAAGPVPAAIRTAKKIFVSNAGADSGLFPHPFSDNPDCGYDQFYAALKSAGDYKLVGDPSEADLVLELRLTAPYGPSNADKVKGTSDPMFRLVIYDIKTHYVLWALTEGIEPANLQRTHDRNFDDALTRLLQDFEALSDKPPATSH